jgi:hypothetical protein
MRFVASVLSAKLRRTGLTAGAFFLLLLMPVIAVAVTGPSPVNRR